MCEWKEPTDFSLTTIQWEKKREREREVRLKHYLEFQENSEKKHFFSEGMQENKNNLRRLELEKERKDKIAKNENRLVLETVLKKTAIIEKFKKVVNKSEEKKKDVDKKYQSNSHSLILQKIEKEKEEEKIIKEEQKFFLKSLKEKEKEVLNEEKKIKNKEKKKDILRKKIETDKEYVMLSKKSNKKFKSTSDKINYLNGLLGKFSPVKNEIKKPFHNIKNLNPIHEENDEDINKEEELKSNYSYKSDFELNYEEELNKNSNISIKKSNSKKINSSYDNSIKILSEETIEKNKIIESKLNLSGSNEILKEESNDDYSSEDDEINKKKINKLINEIESSLKLKKKASDSLNDDIFNQSYPNQEDLSIKDDEKNNKNRCKNVEQKISNSIKSSTIKNESLQKSSSQANLKIEKNNSQVNYDNEEINDDYSSDDDEINKKEINNLINEIESSLKLKKKTSDSPNDDNFNQSYPNQEDLSIKDDEKNIENENKKNVEQKISNSKKKYKKKDDLQQSGSEKKIEIQNISKVNKNKEKFNKDYPSDDDDINKKEINNLINEIESSLKFEKKTSDSPRSYHNQEELSIKDNEKNNKKENEKNVEQKISNSNEEKFKEDYSSDDDEINKKEIDNLLNEIESSLKFEKKTSEYPNNDIFNNKKEDQQQSSYEKKINHINSALENENEIGYDIDFENESDNE